MHRAWALTGRAGLQGHVGGVVGEWVPLANMLEKMVSLCTLVCVGQRSLLRSHLPNFLRQFLISLELTN